MEFPQNEKLLISEFLAFLSDKKIILGFALFAGLGAGILISSLIPKKYASEAIIYTKDILDPVKIKASTQVWETDADMYSEILTSRRLADSLAKDPALVTAIMPIISGNSNDEVYRVLAQSISTSRTSNRALKLKAEFSDPDLPPLILEKAMQTASAIRKNIYEQLQPNVAIPEIYVLDPPNSPSIQIANSKLRNGIAGSLGTFLFAFFWLWAKSFGPGKEIKTGE